VFSRAVDRDASCRSDVRSHGKSRSSVSKIANTCSPLCAGVGPCPVACRNRSLIVGHFLPPRQELLADCCYDGLLAPAYDVAERYSRPSFQPLNRRVWYPGQIIPRMYCSVGTIGCDLYSAAKKHGQPRLDVRMPLTYLASHAFPCLWHAVSGGKCFRDHACALLCAHAWVVRAA